jgi:hypothetical protein
MSVAYTAEHPVECKCENMNNLFSSVASLQGSASKVAGYGLGSRNKIFDHILFLFGVVLNQ